MSAVPSTESHVLVPSLTDMPSAIYINGQFVSVQLNSKATWTLHTDEARYWLELSRVAGEVASRLALVAPEAS